MPRQTQSSTNSFDQPSLKDQCLFVDYQKPLSSPCCSDFLESQNDLSILTQKDKVQSDSCTYNFHQKHLTPQPSTPSFFPHQTYSPSMKKSKKIDPNIQKHFSKSYINQISSQLDEKFGVTKVKRHKFTPNEDKIIQTLVGDQRYPNWNEIALQIPGKNGRQCRERYQHYLCPTVSHDPWTLEEDLLIIQLYKQYGPNWALIAQHFNGCRTNNNIKNRFNNHLSSQCQLNPQKQQFPSTHAPVQQPLFSPFPNSQGELSVNPQFSNIQTEQFNEECNHNYFDDSFHDSDLILDYNPLDFDCFLFNNSFQTEFE